MHESCCSNASQQECLCKTRLCYTTSTTAVNCAGQQRGRSLQVHSAKVALANNGQRLHLEGKNPGGKAKGDEVPAALPRDAVVFQYS